MKAESKQIIKGICVTLSYFIYTYFQIYFLELFNNLDLNSKVFYLLTTEIIYLLILFFIFRDKITADFKIFKKNFKNYINNYMRYWALAFSLMLISNAIIVFLFPNSVATNQSIINDNLLVAPFYMIVSAVLLAPLLEETIFRLSFRYMFKNNILFIFFSGIVFGALHVVGSYQNLIDLIYIIPYSIPGFVFAYTLVKSKNIFVPISLHLFHNGIMMFIQVVLLFFM